MPPEKRRAGENPDGRHPKKKPKFLYSEEAMHSALEAVREGKMSSRKAAREFSVPFSTLQYKVKGKSPEDRKMGPSTVLTKEEEDILVRYIIANAKKGFPLCKRTLAETVQNILNEDNRPNPFSNNKPGRSWLKSFMKRHPGLTQCHAEVINRGRAQVTEDKIRSWGSDLKSHLEEENAADILKDPKRIYNCDESGFRTNPDSGLVLGPINYENFYMIKDGSEKESISCLVTANAAGDVVPPCIVFPYVRIPQEVARNCNPEWSLGRSSSGWMTGQIFFCYIGNTFIPWLKKHNVKFPVLLLIDGHRSHLTLNVCRLCEANQIILFALLPNATHIIQPLDVSVFRASKAGWRILIEAWKKNTKNRVLSRAKFPQLFETVLEERATIKVIQNGFRRCGIYPFDLDNIDYSKCMTHSSRIESTPTTNHANALPAKPTEFGIPHLLFVESCMKENRPEEFREKENKLWDGDESAKELFYLWKKLRSKCRPIENEPAQQTGLEPGQAFQEPPPELGQASQDLPLELGQASQELPPELGQASQELPPELGQASQELPPELGQASQEPPPELGQASQELPPELGQASRELPPELGQASQELPPELGQASQELPPELGQASRELPPELGQASQELPPELGHASQQALPEGRVLTSEPTLEPTPGPSNKIVITPIKIPQCKSLNISPAFMDHIVWPVESPTKKPNRSGKTKERIPHAATSKQWLNYWEALDEQKNKKEEEKQRKKMAREEKSLEKTKNKNKDTTNKPVDSNQKPSTSKKTKTKMRDWFCPKCNGSYNMDVEMCNGRKWVGPCNDCKSWYHQSCISKKLIVEFALDDVSDNDETDFVCDMCFGMSDDDFNLQEAEDTDDDLN